MFLEADDQADLPGRIGGGRGSDVGRSLYKVVNDDLAGFIFKVVLLKRAKSRRTGDSHEQSGGETAERSIHSSQLPPENSDGLLRRLDAFRRRRINGHLVGWL